MSVMSECKRNAYHGLCYINGYMMVLQNFKIASNGYLLGDKNRCNGLL